MRPWQQLSMSITMTSQNGCHLTAQAPANLLCYRLALACMSSDPFHLLRLETIILKAHRVSVAPKRKTMKK